MLPDTQHSIVLSSNSPEPEEIKRSQASVSGAKICKRKQAFPADDVDAKRQRQEDLMEVTDHGISMPSALVDSSAPPTNHATLGTNQHPSFRFSDVSSSPTRSSRSGNDSNESGWITAITSGRNSHTHSIAASLVEKGEDRHTPEQPSLVVAETVERPIPIRNVTSTTLEAVKRSGGHSRFVKNYVRRSHDSLNICKQNMNILLPKESEREIQVLHTRRLDCFTLL